ncbi:MAG TPA: hypothetical protein VJT67_11305 [Longimicrobiaceae bacterium]|nr:hypothetical protein [Longimicrobiaceae bacterium]
MRIFLACPFTKYLRQGAGAPTLDPGFAAFLREAEAELARGGHTVFLAHRVEEYGAKLRPPAVCTPFDMLEMQRADCVVAIPDDSYGVHIELGWASALGRPVVLLLPEGARETTPLLTGLGALGGCDVVTVPADFVENPESRAAAFRALAAALANPPLGRPRGPAVAFVSTSFGFGPISKAVAIAIELKRRRPEVALHYFGAGLDYDFAVRSPAFDRVFRIDVDQPDELRDLVEHLGGYDAVFSVINLDILPFWKGQKTPLYLVDSLAWMWPAPPAGIENVERYFVQDYLLPQERVSAWRDTVPLELVAPIEATAGYGVKRNGGSAAGRLLVNLSGCGNPYVDPGLFEEYAMAIGEAVLDAAAGRELTLCCNERLAKRLRERLAPGPGVRVGHLPHHEFLQALADSSLVLTSPGITTTVEALALGRAPRFLLPQNYSQALISERYSRTLGAEWCMAFSSFGPELECPDGLPEGEGLERVTTSLRTILREKRGALGEQIHRMVQRPARDDEVLRALRGSISRGHTHTGQSTIVTHYLKAVGRKQPVA